MKIKKTTNPFIAAFAGLKILFTTERNFQIHIIVAILAIIACIIFQVKTYEWLIVLAMIGLVLTAEALNTSIEYICNHVCPDIHPTIKKIKDIAAAAVLICAITSVIIGLIIFLPYIYNFLSPYL
ncbi:diacylglycerol kinase family protein [Bacteroidales bacterium OttesenSCG-928-M11]|nr:diacylglycerol kinase family protein [Bacteroidales bacterium OttesenSCG-928-M11]